MDSLHVSIVYYERRDAYTVSLMNGNTVLVSKSFDVPENNEPYVYADGMADTAKAFRAQMGIAGGEVSIIDSISSH